MSKHALACFEVKMDKKLTIAELRGLQRVFLGVDSMDKILAHIVYVFMEDENASPPSGIQFSDAIEYAPKILQRAIDLLEKK